MDINIKEARKRKGFTQFDMARKVGVSVNTYRNWEYQVAEPNEENKKKLMEVLEDEK